MKRLNYKYQFINVISLDEFLNFKESAYLHNDAFSCIVLKNNCNEIFLASDDFDGVNMPDKEIKIEMAEKTDEHISIKIRTASLLDFKLSMLTSLAMCNLTDGIIDLIAFADNLYKFNKQRYTKEEWLNEIIKLF